MAPVIPPGALNNCDADKYVKDPVAPVIPAGALNNCDADKYVKEPVAPVSPLGNWTGLPPTGPVEPIITLFVPLVPIFRVPLPPVAPPGWTALELLSK